ncbi:MAG: chaperone modulator CbpM, partial [Usitatibacter sp.]
MAADHEKVQWLHGRYQVSIVELADTCGVTESIVRELVEYGALAPADPAAQPWTFGAEWVARIRRAARIGEDLELETRGMALVLTYLERIERL